MSAGDIRLGGALGGNRVVRFEPLRLLLRRPRREQRTVVHRVLVRTSSADEIADRRQPYDRGYRYVHQVSQVESKRQRAGDCGLVTRRERGWQRCRLVLQLPRPTPPQPEGPILHRRGQLSDMGGFRPQNRTCCRYEHPLREHLTRLHVGLLL